MGLALGALCLTVLLLFGVGALRLTIASGEVSAASRAAARAAANAYSRADGQIAAAAMADELLGERTGSCRDSRVVVRGDWRPGGLVEATVTCTVSMEGLTLAGFDSNRVVSHRAVEVIDRFRGGAGR